MLICVTGKKRRDMMPDIKISKRGWEIIRSGRFNQDWILDKHNRKAYRKTNTMTLEEALKENEQLKKKIKSYETSINALKIMLLSIHTPTDIHFEEAIKSIIK